MNCPGSHRRLGAALLLAVNVVGGVIAPIVHAFVEHGSRDSRTIAATLDTNAFRDPQTGQIDLDRLAGALALNGHDESKPHSHGTPGAPQGNPFEHGAGSIQHAGIAVLSAASPAVLPVRVIDGPAARTLPPAPEPTLALRHLKAQRSQAPPSVA